MSSSPIDELVETVRAALNAKRADLVRRVAEIENALSAYEYAAESAIAQSFASEHRLKHAAEHERAESAALSLARAVAALPELLAPVSAATKNESADVEIEKAPLLSKLRKRTERGKVVIIGAISGREKSPALPADFAVEAEWIDTAQGGAHAIGNLPQRIKQGRVSGIVILDRVVSHKHTDPVLAAARAAHVPVAFAGQGGHASLLRAFAELQEVDRERT
jgi:VIT1/CCC1 family predicted Fe2+/Mn2+ transporter